MIDKLAVFRDWLSWLDSDSSRIENESKTAVSTEFSRWFPFFFLHAGCALVIFTGCSATALWLCFILYVVRMFAITAFYHRYFSHRSFKTGRLAQFLFAVIGTSAVQRGPLWWAAHHRHHHAESDTTEDIHSPVAQGLIWSHIGWLTTSANMPTDYARVRDFNAYPELRFLNRFDWLVPLLMFCGLGVLGETLRVQRPDLHTSGWQLITWGFFISTTVLFHATSSINSLAHIWGYRTFDTADHSRNNPWLAIITFGEGWHNNHHKYCHSARQGFAWYEIDISYYGLLVLQMLGVVSDLKPVPPTFPGASKSTGLQVSATAGDAV